MILFTVFVFIVGCVYATQAVEPMVECQETHWRDALPCRMQKGRDVPGCVEECEGLAEAVDCGPVVNAECKKRHGVIQCLCEYERLSNETWPLPTSTTDMPTDSNEASDKSERSKASWSGESGEGYLDQFGNEGATGDDGGLGPQADQGGMIVDDGLKRDRYACFDADANVRTDRGLMTMAQLAALAKDDTISIQAWDEQKGEAIYSPLAGWLHADHQMKAGFRRLHINGHAEPLTITPGHVMFVSPTCQHDDVRAALAGELTPGDCVLSVDNLLNQIVDVDNLIMPGVYAPVTEAGTLIVNDVVVSCYANCANQALQHLVYGWLKPWLTHRADVSQLSVEPTMAYRVIEYLQLALMSV